MRSDPRLSWSSFLKHLPCHTHEAARKTGVVHIRNDDSTWEYEVKSTE